MEKSSVFVRGQVWYWEDPIYGSKENSNTGVLQLDATFRFSRYVIVVQTIEDATKIGSIMVIPCSSKTNSIFDVPIQFAYKNNNEVYHYARVPFMFAAHPHSLQRYVCTLSDATMQKLANSLCNLTCPEIQSKDIIVQEILPIDSQPITLPTNKLGAVIPIENLKKPTQKRKGLNAWDEKKIISFLKVYVEEGVEKASKEFKLTIISAKTYYYKWRGKYLTQQIGKTAQC